jgi:hypothetical protein
MAKGDLIELDAAVDIKVNEHVWAGKLSEVVRINVDLLQADMVRQPGLVSWFGVVAVEATDRVKGIQNKIADMKEEQDSIYAELDMIVRTEHKGDSKPPTEPAVKAMVLTHEKYKTFLKDMSTKREELREALKIESTLIKILIGLEHKKDMIIQISATNRREGRAGDYNREGPME